MIFLSPDYVSKYSDVLGELLALARMDSFSYDYIEKTISQSKVFKDFENSDVTEIAYRSTMSIYRNLFPSGKAIDKDIVLFSPYYWIGEAYIHMFLKYKITFETLFAYFPLNNMEKLFIPYHEMGMNQLDEYAEKVLLETPLKVWMRKRKVFCTDLSNKTGIPLSTIRALKTGKRSINKLQFDYLERIASYLRVDSRSLIQNITLYLYEPEYSKNNSLNSEKEKE